MCNAPSRATLRRKYEIWKWRHEIEFGLILRVHLLRTHALNRLSDLRTRARTRNWFHYCVCCVCRPFRFRFNGYHCYGRCEHRLLGSVPTQRRWTFEHTYMSIISGNAIDMRYAARHEAFKSSSAACRCLKIDFSSVVSDIISLNEFCIECVRRWILDRFQ